MKLSATVRALGSLALLASCASTSSVRTERITFDERVVFHSTAREPKRSLSILNLGPGPVEVNLGAAGEHSHGIELPEGVLEYVVLGELHTLEIRHSSSGSANVEWSVHEDLRDRIRVEVDGPPPESGGTGGSDAGN